MLETIKYINKLCRESSVVRCRHLCYTDIHQDQPCLLNYVVTDGETVVATRYAFSQILRAPTLQNSDMFPPALPRRRLYSSLLAPHSTRLKRAGRIE